MSTAQDQKRFRENVKAQAFAAYGGYCCAECGETSRPFLVLSYVGGDRAQAGQSLPKGGWWYYKLRRAGFPTDPPIRVRCLNCSRKAWLSRTPRMRCLLAYGGVSPRCQCCGIEDLDVLTLAYKKGHARANRRKLHCSQGTPFFQKLIKLGFPNDPELVVLCWNCNRGSYMNGGICPHKQSAP